MPNLPRYDDGTLQKFSLVGLYPIFYIDAGNNALCPECAQEADEQRADFPECALVAAEANYEDPDLSCSDCCARIPAAYID